jgi:hypothetical protein
MISHLPPSSRTFFCKIISLILYMHDMHTILYTNYKNKSVFIYSNAYKWRFYLLLNAHLVESSRKIKKAQGK